MAIIDFIGRAIRWACWAVIALIIFLWLVIPLVDLSQDAVNPHTDFSILFMEVFWGKSGEKFIGILIPFIILGIGLKVGSYLQEYGQRREASTEATALGYLKLRGRVSLSDLASHVGLSLKDTIRMLSRLRQKRDIVFNIDREEVYMAGYERERPRERETLKEVVKEVVKIPCNHCGSLVDPNVGKCPNCGAPPK